MIQAAPLRLVVATKLSMDAPFFAIRRLLPLVLHGSLVGHTAPIFILSNVLVGKHMRFLFTLFFLGSYVLINPIAGSTTSFGDEERLAAGLKQYDRVREVFDSYRLPSDDEESVPRVTNTRVARSYEEIPHKDYDLLDVVRIKSDVSEGVIGAKYLLASLFFLGSFAGVKYDFYGAEKLYKQVIEEDDWPEAKCGLALLYKSKWWTPFSEIQDLLDQAKERGYPAAYMEDFYFFRWRNWNDILYHRTPALMRELNIKLLHAAQSGSPTAQKCLAEDLLCKSGKSAEAMYWLEKAGETQCESFYSLAQIYDGSEEVDPPVVENLSKALELYQRACDGGDERAAFELGEFYLDGTSVTPRNPETARGYYEKAYELENGDVPDLYLRLGKMYSEGVGGEKSEDKALELYLKASEAGLSEGDMAVAVLSEHSENPEVRDPARAHKHYKKLLVRGGDVSEIEEKLLALEEAYPELAEKEDFTCVVQ